MPAESGGNPLLYLFFIIMHACWIRRTFFPTNYCILLVICPLYLIFPRILLSSLSVSGQKFNSNVLHSSLLWKNNLGPFKHGGILHASGSRRYCACAPSRLSTSQFDWPRADVHLFLQQLQFFPLFWGPNNKMLLLHVENIRNFGSLTRF